MEDKQETDNTKSMEETKTEKTEVFTIDDKDAEVPDLTFQYKPDSQNNDKQRGIISKLKGRINGFIQKHKSRIKAFVAVVCLLLYLGYVGYSLFYRFGDEGSWRLLIGTALGLLMIVWRIFTGSNAYKKMSEGFNKLTVPEKVKLVVKW